MLFLKNKILFQLFIIYLRYLIGGAFVFASFIKIKGYRFTSTSGEMEPIRSAWHFFETLYQSGLYWQFLGMGQLVAGALLMTQKYALLGALMFLPIISNVFVITISYDFGGTPIITGGMLLANIFLVLWDWNKVQVLVNMPLMQDVPNRVENHVIWAYTGIFLLGFTSVYRILVDKYDIFFWFVGCFLIGLSGFLGWFFLKK